MQSEFFKNKKNLAILGAVVLVCIAFVVGAIRSDRKQGTPEAESPGAQEQIAAEAETKTATPSDMQETKRVFSRPASTLKDISGDEGEEEEFVPAPFKLNLAYFYPEGADTSDSIHSYAGKIFQTLNTLNADYLANYYDMSDMTPLSFANRQGRGVGSIMGKYNPNDSRHDPKDSSTWKINSFRNVSVNFYDGDGNRINGYYAVQEIMSMASVYAYYHDMNDAEAMEEYCRELFKNAMSSRVSMGNVYYDSGCLNRTKQDEAAEAIAMEAQQLATEHQLAGATALSSGMILNTGSADSAGGNVATVQDNAAAAGSDGLAQEGASGSLFIIQPTEGADNAGTLSQPVSSTIVSSPSTGNRVQDMDSQVVVSHARGSAETAADAESSAAEKSEGTESIAAESSESAASQTETAGPSEETHAETAASDGIVSSGTEAETSPSYAIVNSDTLSGSSSSVSSETSGDVVTSGSDNVVSEAPAAPAEDAYQEEDLVVSPAMNIRRLFGMIRRPFMKSAVSGILSPVFRLADEDVVVSPASATLPETAAAADSGYSEAVISSGSENAGSSISEVPASPETEAPVAEAAETQNTQTENIPAESVQTETAAEQSTEYSAASDIPDAVEVTSGSDGMEETTAEGTVVSGSGTAQNYGYAVVGSNGAVYRPGSGNVVSEGNPISETYAYQAEPEELTEEEAAIAAQINDLLAQANVLSGADKYCPGHIDLYITITIKGIDDRNGLFKADKIGNDEANFNDRWQGWTTDKIAEAKALNHQDWFEKYGLSISSINLTSQLTEDEIQHYLATLPGDVSEARRAVVDFALHSVGKVPYYWGGKPSGPGYSPNHFYSLVGADYHGRILRGLDCSGWVNWVYWSATGQALAGESTGTLIGCGRKISRASLRPGDIIIRTGADAHVVMFLGWVGNGNFIGIHETGGVRNNVVVGEMTASWPYYRSLLD